MDHKLCIICTAMMEGSVNKYIYIPCLITDIDRPSTLTCQCTLHSPLVPHHEGLASTRQASSNQITVSMERFRYTVSEIGVSESNLWPAVTYEERLQSTLRAYIARHQYIPTEVAPNFALLNRKCAGRKQTDMARTIVSCPLSAHLAT